MNETTIVKIGKKTNELKKIEEHCATNAFFLIKPHENNNAKEIAQKLLMLDNIEEVFIIDDGFIAKSNSIDDKISEKIEMFISKNIKSNFHKLCSYYKIKK